MAELTADAVRASAEACVAAWGRAELAAATRGTGDAPRFDSVFAHWPLLGSADALAVALEVPAGPEARGRPLAAWLAAARVRASVAPSVARLEEWRRRAVVRLPGGPRVAWRDVPARLAGLAGDPTTRRTLGEARAALASEGLAPLARERVARTCGAVEALDLASGYDETVARLTGDTPAVRTALAADWLARTDAVWIDTLAERSRRSLGIPVRDLHASDLPALLAGGDDAGAVRGSALAAAVRTQLTAMGLDPDARGRLRVAIAGDGEPGLARTFAVRVPGEVYLVVPAGGAADAPRAFLDAVGRALHLAHADPALPFELRWQVSDVAAMATGALLAALLRDRGWLRRYAGISGGAGAVRAAAFRELAAVRTAAARAAVSAAAYGDTVSLGELEGVYVDRMQTALGVPPDRGDTAAELDAPFAVGDAVHGALLGSALTESLRERFDEDWWRNPRTGAWLATEWFGSGPHAQPVVDPRLLAGALTRVLE